MVLLLYLSVVAISKNFNLIIYLFIYLFFQNYPLSQYYRDHQFWGVSKTRGRGLSFFKECCFRVEVRVRLDTNRKPNPKTAFFRKKIEPDPGTGPDPVHAFYWHPSQRKSSASPICEIKIWGNSNCESVTTENIYGTRVIYDLWICSCNGEYKREIRQYLKFWPVRPFSASLNAKNGSWLHNSNQFFKRRSNFSVRKWAMNTSLTWVFLYFYVICNSYHLFTKRL